MRADHLRRDAGRGREKLEWRRIAIAELPKNIIVLDSNFEEILISAERYACGRKTYIVHDTVTYILGLLPFLSDWCIGVMLEDMRGKFIMYERSDGWFGLGDPCDIADWKYFREALEKERDKREEESK